MTPKTTLCYLILFDGSFLKVKQLHNRIHWIGLQKDLHLRFDTVFKHYVSKCYLIL